MKGQPPLSEGAKLRARYLALKWRAQALLQVGSENGYLTDAERSEWLELAELLTHASSRPGTPDDMRVQRVIDVMTATSMSQMAACRWVLAAIDAKGEQPTAAQIEVISDGRIEGLSAKVSKHLESTTGLRSHFSGTAGEDPDPGA
ncbi:MAG TPA: hypothetical protein VIT90_02665 [Lysobacter sp.]